MRTIVLLCGLLAASPAAAQFAGRWQVQVQTDVGECPSGEIGVRVEGNNLVATEAEGVTPWGYIEGNQIVANFRGGPDVLRAHGNLRGRAASGAWSSPTRYCGGRWSARKID